jgi:hypothetical protein
MKKKTNPSKSMTANLSELIAPCPKCGRRITWFNDIPLRGFCWGTPDNEHEEHSVVVCTKTLAKLSSRK